MAKAAPKPMTKTEIFSNIADSTGLSKKQVAEVFDALTEQIEKSLVGRGAPEIFTLPGLCKFTVAKKPATKEREGINPFTGEPTIFKAKPASKNVKLRPLKKLKDMVQ